MGVTGLWRLIEPAGKPVPVETLENKVLAVDISIWLHQMVKGYQDAKGAPLANAHLMGLFQRLCKLLYFRIKPIFVFDGAFPALKKETIAKRQENKSKYNSESERLKRELAIILSKKTAIGSLLGKHTSPKKAHHNPVNDDDIFKLPALPQREEEESESESEDESSSSSTIDLHSVDIESPNFKSLPIKEKYDLLVELKETRKMNSWGRLHELPKKSDNFSDFQMQRLLKRRKVQECLEETEKEMGDCGMSLLELESLLNEEGIDTKIDSLPGRRIASNDNTRIVLINDVKQALTNAKKKREAESNPPITTIVEETEPEAETKKDELEEDLEKAIKMSLECVNEPESEPCASKTDDSWTTFMTDSDYSDSEDEDGFEQPSLSTAKAYIMQYTDFTSKAIGELVTSKKSHENTKTKAPRVDKIIEELNNEKSIIVDNIALSSDEEDVVAHSESAASTEELDNYEKVCSKSIEEMDSNEIIDTSTDNDNVDTSQSSIICIENTSQEIISLDSTMEEQRKPGVEMVTETAAEINEVIKSSEESSSDDEFEEVLDEDPEPAKSVIQLKLNVGEAPEDDIFADIFTKDTEEQRRHKEIDECKPGCSRDIIPKRFDPSVDVIPDVLLKSITKSIESTIYNTSAQLKSEPPLREKESCTFVDTQKKSIELPESSAQSNEKQEELKKLAENESISEVRNKTPPPKEPISRETLNTMAEELQMEEQELLQEKGRLDRIGLNITEQMTKDAQELLQIFGIPYIVAPMEAEAQCAFLESTNLTDGTITDDSDIWLFGGRTVYKNFFNQKKHVLQFLAERIEKSYNLTREQLILLALLVGSDYTTGVSGVGPVTALEILATFPFNKKQFLNETSEQVRYNHVVAGLQEFKKWVRAGRRTDNISLKRKLKNVDLNEEFPSIRVVQAYLEPNVEKSDEKFTWGQVDVTVLRDYTRAKFGWSQNKLDEIIKPVLKRLLDRKNQKSVQDYFKRKVDFQSLEEQMSKRVKAAVQRMGPEDSSEQSAEPSTEQKGKPARKRKVDTSKDTDPKAGPSKVKQVKNTEKTVLTDLKVRVVSSTEDGKSSIEINIPKTDRVQEIIPQRERDKQCLLQNKMKAIEVFRKSKIDRKKKPTKRRPNLPKEKADLSESSDSN